MSDKKREAEQDPLTEEELERANGDELPNREVMSVITPHVESPGYTLPVEPSD